jgi:hypothetical protein
VFGFVFGATRRQQRRDGHRDGFSSKSKSRFRVSVALQKRSHARPASIAAGTVCERKQQRRASSLGRRAARGVPREVPRRRRAPPAGARPDGRAARAETGAHFSRAAARRPSRSPPCRRFERLGFQKTTREAHLVGGASCLPRDSRRTCSSDTVCCICASFSRLLWNIVGRSERAPRGGRSGAPASERDPTNTTKKRSSASPPTQLTRRLGTKTQKPRTRTREQSAKNADNKQKPSMRPR